MDSHTPRGAHFTFCLQLVRHTTGCTVLAPVSCRRGDAPTDLASFANAALLATVLTYAHAKRKGEGRNNQMTASTYAGATVGRRAGQPGAARGSQGHSQGQQAAIPARHSEVVAAQCC